jgi:ABC-type multidrug transport system permease subunit
MANSRPEPTLADYMAIAISPALIMVLVSSLAYFLLTVFYAGEFEGRMYWTMTCFVFAAVLISRVSIMEGAERASMFGLALGGVAALAMIKFTDHPWWAW